MFQFQPLVARFSRTITESICSCVVIVGSRGPVERAALLMAMPSPRAAPLRPGAALATPLFDVVIVN
jgi:hypothetical protein